MTKKIPCILIFHDNKFLTDFTKKRISVILFLQNSAQLLKKISVLPSSTTQYLVNIQCTKDDIKRIICKLDPNKAHGYDVISIGMLKMSGDAIIEPLFKISKNIPRNIQKIYSNDWKKGNLVPIFKKDRKQSIKNCRPLSLFQSVARFPNVSYTITR